VKSIKMSTQGGGKKGEKKSTRRKEEAKSVLPEGKRMGNNSRGNKVKMKTNRPGMNPG